METWLSVVGVGEDGLDGITPVGRTLLHQSRIIVGGKRHLGLLPTEDKRKKLTWTSPISDVIHQIIQHRGESVCVLASGDPMCYGIGVTLIQHIPFTEMRIIPAPSAFSLACARLGWSLTEVETLSLCGRDLALLNALLYLKAKILVLSGDKTTPVKVAHYLTHQGYGNSQITVLERMGGPNERVTSGLASSWTLTDLADLNTIALTVLPTDPFSTSHSPHTPGLPDSAYHHDGQLTKKEVRAITLSALAPTPGQLLWDVGAGCGSIAIEWMRSGRGCRAIAIDHHPIRCQYITDNAVTLGVPHLTIVVGDAPQALQNLPEPDAIFIGGGLTTPELLTTCWQFLRYGGRLVANAVTVEGESLLYQWHHQWGGSLTRIAIQRAEPVGKFLGWKALAPITQWTATKPPHLLSPNSCHAQ